MNHLDKASKADKIEHDEAVKVLHECVNLMDHEFSPPNKNFRRLLDLTGLHTHFTKASMHLTWSESDLAASVMMQLFSYMYERSKNNDPEEVKRRLKQGIVEMSRLYATVILNTPTITEETKEVKND